MANQYENEIRTVIENWALSVRKEKIEGILANHDKDIVMFDVPFPVQSKGIDEYKKTWDLYFSWSRTGIFDIIEMKYVATADLGFAYGLMRCTGSKDGEAQDLTFRLTVCLMKKAGEWVICHEHHSLPSE